MHTLSLCVVLLAAGCKASGKPIFITHDVHSGVKGVPYSLPRTVVEATLTVSKPDPGKKEYRLALALGAMTVPDPEASFVIEHNARASRADLFTVTSSDSGSGLLKAINATSTDQALEIVKKLAGAVSGFSVTPFTIHSENVGELPKLEDFLEGRVGTHKFLIPLDGTPTPDNLNYAIAPTVMPFGKSVPIMLKLVGSSLVRQSDGASAPLAASLPKLPASGIVTRPRQPIHVTADVVATGSDGTLTATTQAVMSIPDYAPVVTVPFDRAPLVKTIYKSTFADGVLTSHDVDRPSTALAVASAPLDLMKEILEVPATLVQLKFNLTDKQKSLAEKEKGLEEATRAPTQESVAVEQNRLLADYQIAFASAQAALAVYKAAATQAEKAAALLAYLTAARDANEAAILAGVAQPYDLSVLP